MTLRQRQKNPLVLMRVGLAFLVLASCARWFLRPDRGLHVPAGAVDLLTGVLYGIAIGTLLLSLVRNRLPRAGE